MDRFTPRGLRSAFDAFLDEDYRGAPGDVNVFSIVDVFCRNESDAVDLAQHLTSTVTYGGSHSDHGDTSTSGHFDFTYNPRSIKARFILWGSPDWQSHVLSELHQSSRSLTRTNGEDSSLGEFDHRQSSANSADRYGYSSE